MEPLSAGMARLIDAAVRCHWDKFGVDKSVAGRPPSTTLMKETVHATKISDKCVTASLDRLRF